MSGFWVKITWRCAAILVLVLAPNALSAQDSTTQTPPASLPKGGLQSTISLYGVYYSHSLPNGGSFQPGATSLPSDFGAGGSAVLNWTKFSERSTVSLTYTPSFTARVRFSSLDALNHALSFNNRRKLAPRWTLGFSVAGDYSNLEQSMFAPTTLSTVASVPATFDDLAAGVTGKFTNNPQLGVALTNAALVESPLRNLLYGQRMFTASGQVSLSYSHSPRLSVTFSGGGTRTQHVSQDQPVTTSNAFLLPDTTSGNASATLSYSLSPITQLGGSVTTIRVSSFLLDYFTTTSLATWGRTIGRSWLLQIHGGVGVTKSVSTSSTIPTQPRPSAGGSIGFKTFSHTLLATIDRTVSDTYGLGANTTTSANGAWRWRRPGNSWWLEANGGWQKLAGDALSETNNEGWHVLAGFGRAFGLHLAVVTQYTYLSYSGSLQTSTSSLSQSAVRVNLTWSPQQTALQ